ncbi:MAG TPA: hypothetical protein H9729_03810 [Candidatus Borkfalkia excrementigallinarum]|uniref:Extracellular solute-binding protein n=1 Tax=Candidatus Borkfalkia excrementigallinarum TaxID=2838506 RepID=A0A9D1ZWN7_9FIRM|nr:hypothetical protein [Candidatus Borkfalkia excrementigallinarum]
MKVKKVLKFFAVILGIAVGVFSLIGCSNGSSETEISLFKWDFASLNAARRQNTPIYATLKEKAHGLDLKSITCGYGDWESTINNLYNTQNLPDVFIHYTVDRPQVFRKMVRDEAVLNWNDYVTQEKYPNIYERLHEYKWLVDRIEYLNGGYYFLPITIKQTHVMFVRQDWINNLNAKLPSILVQEGIISSEAQMTDELYETHKFVLPETLLEFYRLAKAFTIYDPDGNGQDDTYGYTCSGDLMWYNNWIFQAMDSTYWGWVETQDNSITASWVTDENKAAVSFLNRLFEEGIMDPDYTAMTDPTKIQNFCSNRTGIMVDNVYYNTYVEQLRAANNMTREEAESAVAVIAPPKGKNGSYGTRGNPGFWCGVCIRGDLSENKITAILDLFEFMLSDEGYNLFTYGVEGEHYKIDSEGQKVSLMGVDANGYNFTAKSMDSAFDMHMFVDWSLSYNPGFSTNYERVKGYMEMAESYTYVDSTVYVQTPLVISNWDTIGQDSYEYFVRLISTDFNDYNKDKIGTVSWDSIEVSNTAYENAWNEFKKEFLESWGGKELIEEYAPAAKAYLQ